MKIGSKKISWSRILGGVKILFKGLTSAYLTRAQGEDKDTVSWKELTMIMLEVAAYFELPVDTKGLKVPASLQDKLSKYL